MKRVMAVYDVDCFYAQRLADVLNQKEKIPFTVMSFSSMERLSAYADKNPVEVLLISREVRQEDLALFSRTRIITLADQETVPAGQSYPSIYKYQSSDEIIREVMACYCEEGEEQILAMSGTRTILGVYSPIGRCLKTSFALTLGQLLSRDTRVLYVNLEACSGFTALLKTEYKGDLSDVMYFYKQGDCHAMRLSSMIHTIGSLDYLPPPRYPEDLEQLSSEQMADLLQKISKEAGYEIVIVDVGQYGRQVLPILKACNQIYMPIKEDSLSVAKLEEFFDYLQASGDQWLEERIQKLKLPYHSSFGRKEDYMEQLLWGELGDYVRQLMKGQAGLWKS